ncbi:MAG: CDP-alcohol phosphatidyltransferase family protein [Candidatus Saccharimonas sp.]
MSKLPLLNGIKSTARQWPEYSKRQKLGTVLASTLTAVRPFAREVVERAFEANELSRMQAVGAHAVIDVLDKADGIAARYFQAVTPLGKELDPLVDHVDAAVQEWRRVRRGEMALGSFMLRVTRDIGSTAIRTCKADQAATESKQAEVGANGWGKASSTVRVLANRYSDAQPNTRLAKVLEHSATGLMMYSLYKNAKAHRQ